MRLDLALACRHYPGGRPCAIASRCACPACEPALPRVLIIELGALGDVIRTACLLPTLRRVYPKAHITWVSRPNGLRVLASHPLIDRLVAFDAEGLLTLSQQSFDLVLSLDKEAAPAALCNAVRCPDKRGMRLSPYGTVQPANPACEPYFRLGLDNHRKFRVNRKSYPQLIHEALDLPYAGEPYRLYCSLRATERARGVVAPARAAGGRALVGLNTGAGRAFAHEAPSTPRWIELAAALHRRRLTPVLLGGPDEARQHAEIVRALGRAVFASGTDHNEEGFVAVIDQCDVVVTGDTMALHAAVAREVPVVALFGPTCEQEIDLYGWGRKLVTTHPCHPCYRRNCSESPSCTDVIAVDTIVEAVEGVLAEHRRLREAHRTPATLDVPAPTAPSDGRPAQTVNAAPASCVGRRDRAPG